MLQRKFKEDIDISKIPTFLPFISTIVYHFEPLYELEMTMDCKVKIKHIKSDWSYSWKPSSPHYIVDEDDNFVNPWVIKPGFNHGMDRYAICCNNIAKIEIYMDSNRGISTVVYRDETGEVKTQSFPIDTHHQG